MSEVWHGFDIGALKMKPIIWMALSLVLLSAGCNKSNTDSVNSTVETHSSVGVITGFGDNNKVITIKHKAFPDGFMQAMEMSFELQDSSLANGFKVGDKVEFTLQHIDDSYPLVRLKKVSN
jgi:Cu/Ag efflux protein CusF